MRDDLEALLDRAAAAVASADALVIAAGAGMGVDSGLPDFRGTEGFWKAYPPYQKLNLEFMDVANPQWFRDDPTLAWGFYGHRLNLYRAAIPHAGFAILRRWAAAKRGGAFIFTSNVDGQFQKAGFSEDQIVECHGSVHWMQCLNGCGGGIFSAAETAVAIDEESMRATEPLPQCQHCGGAARPNILMFDDYHWDARRTDQQRQRLQAWVQALTAPPVVIECGAGLAIPTVRHFSERGAKAAHATLIRINLRECNVPAKHIGLPLGALAALQALDERLAG